MNVIPLPAFQDNDLWMLHDGRRALVVDPGDALPVLACSQRDGLQLEAILVARHHPDHIGGVSEPRDAAGAAVHGLSREPFARAVEPHDNEQVHYLKRCEELRAQNLPTRPSTIARERRINPFLRMRLSGAAQAARANDGTAHQDDVAVFATLRQCKNEFK